MLARHVPHSCNPNIGKVLHSCNSHTWDGWRHESWEFKAHLSYMKHCLEKQNNKLSGDSVHLQSQHSEAGRSLSLSPSWSTESSRTANKGTHRNPVSKNKHTKTILIHLAATLVRLTESLS